MQEQTWIWLFKTVMSAAFPPGTCSNCALAVSAQLTVLSCAHGADVIVFRYHVDLGARHLTGKAATPGCLYRTGRVTPQVEELIGQIKQAASEAPPRLQDIGVDGSFNGLLNTTNYLDDDACSTLGTITFQQFAPKDLKVLLYLDHYPCSRSLLKGAGKLTAPCHLV